MQTSQISFDLENKSEQDAMVVLIPASLRRNVKLKDKFLTLGSFKDESGTHELVASNESPERAISELDEYVSQLENVSVSAVFIETGNFTQATLNLIQRQYIEFKAAETTNIETEATVEAGKSGVLHSFKQPFLSGKMRSLEMKLLKNQKVRITLDVQMPGAAPNLPVLS